MKIWKAIACFGMVGALMAEEPTQITQKNIAQLLEKAKTDESSRNKVLYEFAYGLHDMELRAQVREAQLVSSQDYGSMTSLELRYLLGSVVIEKEGDIYVPPQGYLEALHLKADQEDLLCQSALGLIYGLPGPKKDPKMAKEYLEKVAQKEYVWGYSDLGFLYSRGDGVDQSYEEAVRLWTIAAKKGSSVVQYPLFGSYLKGVGVEKDPVQALSCLKSGAELGDLRCQKVLARRYLFGLGGVERDLGQAHIWLRRALYNKTLKKQDPRVIEVFSALKIMEMQASFSSSLMFLIGEDTSFVIDFQATKSQQEKNIADHVWKLFHQDKDSGEDLKVVSSWLGTLCQQGDPMGKIVMDLFSLLGVLAENGEAFYKIMSEEGWEEKVNLLSIELEQHAEELVAFLKKKLQTDMRS